MEKEINAARFTDKKGEKIKKAYKLLEKDSSNEIAICYIHNYYFNKNRDSILPFYDNVLKKDPFNQGVISLICRDYYRADSITVFFDNLIKKYPNRIEPYLLRADNLYFEYNYLDKINHNKLAIKCLDAAFRIDTSNEDVLYSLAKTYYKDFIYPREQDKRYFIFDDDDDSTFFITPVETIKKSAFEYAADSALKYLYKLWDISTIEAKEKIYFPIRQLECYLKCRDKSPIKETVLHTNYCYFPPWYFANLSENWECDTTVDYFDINFYKNEEGWLAYLKEPCLYNRLLEENTIVFRFMWARSFHNPICIRLEKNDKEIILYWKVVRGMGGYEPEGIEVSSKRKISENEWNEFVYLFNKMDFYNLPNEKYVLMTDGASWTLEYKTKDNFKAHKTNFPETNKAFKDGCLFLLKLTNIKIKEDEIY